MFVKGQPLLLYLRLLQYSVVTLILNKRRLDVLLKEKLEDFLHGSKLPDISPFYNIWIRPNLLTIDSRCLISSVSYNFSEKST